MGPGCVVPEPAAADSAALGPGVVEVVEAGPEAAALERAAGPGRGAAEEPVSAVPVVREPVATPGSPVRQVAGSVGLPVRNRGVGRPVVVRRWGQVPAGPMMAALPTAVRLLELADPRQESPGADRPVRAVGNSW